MVIDALLLGFLTAFSFAGIAIASAAGGGGGGGGGFDGTVKFTTSSFGAVFGFVFGGADGVLVLGLPLPREGGGGGPWVETSMFKGAAGGEGTGF